MSETYTGLNAVPATSLKTEIFNKTAINADTIKDRLYFYGAEIITKKTGAFIPNTRPSQGSDQTYIIPFELKCYDTGEFWSPTRPLGFYIPNGISYAELTLHYQMPFREFDNPQMGIYKNGDGHITTLGTSPFDPRAFGSSNTGAQVKEFSLTTGIVAVSSGDFFTAWVSSAAVIANPTGILNTTMLDDYSGSSTTAFNRNPCLTFSIRGYK